MCTGSLGGGRTARKRASSDPRMARIGSAGITSGLAVIRPQSAVSSKWSLPLPTTGLLLRESSRPSFQWDCFSELEDQTAIIEVSTWFYPADRALPVLR
jgi:hypothetical protein